MGDLEWQNRGFEAAVVNALKDIPVRMISYGGSNYNISLLIRKEDKDQCPQTAQREPILIITINILKTYFPLDRLRAESTPFYYYDMQLLDETINCIKKSAAYPGFYVHYAVKANANPEILKRIAAA